MTTLTRQLTAMITDKPVSAGDLKQARMFLLDAAANIVAGQNSVAGQKLLKWARDIAPDDNLNKLDVARKSFLLGSLCHILEVDDLHRTSVVHPGCVVAPVIFSLGVGVNGSNALRAFLQGVEATTRVGMAVGPEHYKIWHNTATCGPYGSAMAGAYLLGLDEDQTVDALGNAGSQSAGLWQFLDSGAETKHLHAGRGAESGLVAAQLASHGFTGAPDILEGERGFFKATCSHPPIENLLRNPIAPWQIHMTSIKPWPSCRHTHPTIEAALILHQKFAESLAQIKSITIDTYHSALNLCDRPDPHSVYGAKFSLQHCLATALGNGRVELSSFDAQARTKAANLSSLVSIQLSGVYEAAYPDNWGSKVTLCFANGREVQQETSSAKGDPDSALSESEMISKAQKLLAFSGIDQSDQLIDQICAMENGGPTPDLIKYLRF